MAAWSELPTELLKVIFGRLDTSFELVHFRSVCSSWRSAVHLPDNFHFLDIKTNIPSTLEDEYRLLKMIPVFLIRLKTSSSFDYLLAEVREREPGKPMLMKSPLSLDGITNGRDSKLFNSLTSQIIQFEHYYEITLPAGEYWGESSERVEYLKLHGEDCKDFVVLAGINSYRMQMFTSRNMSWTQVVGHPNADGVYQDMVAFKGKFYVVDSSGWGQVFAIKLSSEVTEIPSVRGSPHKSDQECLVKSGEELLLVQQFTPRNHFRESMYTWFRVFKLNEEEGRMNWVQVNDLNDRVIFIGPWWNLCCSVQKLPGAKENSIVFIDWSDDESIVLFDLRTRMIRTASSECRGCMGAFGLNLESLVSHGVVTLPN